MSSNIQSFNFSNSPPTKKVASDTTVNKKFAPVGQQINSIIGRAAFYGSSKSALSMTSAIFANHSYILGESDSTFVDGLRARADFIEAAAMSATSTIVNFFYSIGATVLAIGAFGQSETMNAAFTRNWMHTKVSFKAAVGSAIGGLTPGGAAYFYEGAATDVAVRLGNDVTNIIQAAADSKLTDEELTRGLISYLKTELAGAGRNGLSLAKRIAPQAIEFLTQAIEIKIKAKQAQEISDLETSHKDTLKENLKNVKNKKEKEHIRDKFKKEHTAELKRTREAHKHALTQNTNFFNTLSNAFKEDSTFKEIGSYVSNTLDGLANACKGEKGEEALKKNEKAKDESYDKIANLGAKNFSVASAKDSLAYIENNPIKAAPVSENLNAALKEAQKVKDPTARKAAVKAANNNITAAKKQNKKFAAAQQKIKEIEANARVAMASKHIEILVKYNELKEVRAAHEVAQKRLDKLADGSKKRNTDACETERKDLEKTITKYSNNETKIEKAMNKIYVKSLKIEGKAIVKQVNSVLAHDKKFEAKFNANRSEIISLDRAIGELNAAIGNLDPDNRDDALQAALLEEQRAPLGVKYKDIVAENDYIQRERGSFSEQLQSFSDRRSEIQEGTEQGIGNVDSYVARSVEETMTTVSNGFKTAVEAASGKTGIIPTLNKLARQFVGTWFKHSRNNFDMFS